MWRSSRKVAQRLGTTATRDRRRFATAAATGTAFVWWSVPCAFGTALLDDGRYAGGEDRKAEEGSPAREQDAWREAYKNAKRDGNAAREATFQQAGAFLRRSGCYARLVGELPADDTVIYIFQRMGVARSDIRYWTLSASPSSPDPVGAVYVAANLDPSDMDNHLILTTALQFELDALRAEGRLAGENGVVKAVVQYREVVVELEYGVGKGEGGGRFTPVIRNQITGRRVKFEPLERMRIEMGEGGMPLLMPEGRLRGGESKDAGT